MIYSTIGESCFIDAFHNMGRGDQFSYTGKQQLFAYLEDLSDDCNIELDVIGLCCDYVELSIVSAYREYANDIDLNLDDDDQLLFDLYYGTDQEDDQLSAILHDAVIDYFEYNTVVIYAGDENILFGSF